MVAVVDQGEEGPDDERDAGGPPQQRAIEEGTSPASDRGVTLALEPERCAREGAVTAGDHSMTWSARSRSAGGIVNPAAFAVLALMTSSNTVGCSIGSSAGFAPRKILSR